MLTYSLQDVAMAIPACRQAQSAHMSAISQLQQFVQQGKFGATMAATMAALLEATVCLQVLVLINWFSFSNSITNIIIYW